METKLDSSFTKAHILTTAFQLRFILNTLCFVESFFHQVFVLAVIIKKLVYIHIHSEIHRRTIMALLLHFDCMEKGWKDVYPLSVFIVLLCAMFKRASGYSVVYLATVAPNTECLGSFSTRG